NLAIANTFVGSQAGINNTTGGANSFFGNSAGMHITTGGNNTIIGYLADTIGNMSNATAIGANAQVAASNCLVLGSIAGINGATASVNVGIGTTVPNPRLDVTSSSSQVRFGNVSTDVGGYLISTTDSQAIMSGGAKWDGSNWIARATAASLTDQAN